MLASHFLRCRTRIARKPWKSTFSITPLSFDSSSSRNIRRIRINLISPETRVIALHGSMGLSSFKFSWWAPKDARRVQNGRSIWSKVIDFGTNWKGVCSFLLVTNSYLGPILPRFQKYCRFLPARRYASAGLCDSDVSAPLSVCHTPVLCLSERKRIVKCTPSDSPMILVSGEVWFTEKFARGHPKGTCQMRVGWVFFRRYSTNMCHISKTVHFRHKVTMGR